MGNFTFVNIIQQNYPVLYLFRLSSQKFINVYLCILAINKQKSQVLISFGRLPVKKIKVDLQPK